MAWIDTTMVVVICTLLVLIVWARVMDQSIYDTVMEIKDIFTDLGK